MQWFLALILVLNVLVGIYGTFKTYSIGEVRPQEVQAEQVHQLHFNWQSKMAASEPSPRLPPVPPTARTVSVPETKAEKANKLKSSEIAPTCLHWGPIDNQQLTKIKDSLLLLKIKAEYLSENREDTHADTYQYWVYYPPLPSQTETAELSSELKELGFENHIVKHTNFAGHLSLGLFSKGDAATRLVEELTAAGYDQVEVTRHRPQANKITLRFKSLGTRQVEQLKILQKRLTPEISLKACR